MTKVRKYKKGRMMLVDLHDLHSWGGWIDEAKRADLVAEGQVIGFYEDQDKDYLHLAQADIDGQVFNLFSIPLGAIKKVHTLKMVTRGEE